MVGFTRGAEVIEIDKNMNKPEEAIVAKLRRLRVRDPDQSEVVVRYGGKSRFFALRDNCFVEDAGSAPGTETPRFKAGNGAIVMGKSYIGDEVVLADRALIKDSKLAGRISVTGNSRIQNSIIKCKVGAGEVELNNVDMSGVSAVFYNSGKITGSSERSTQTELNRLKKGTELEGEPLAWLRRDYSGILSVQRCIVVDSQVNLIIDDVSYRASGPLREGIQLMIESSWKYLKVFDAEKLVANIALMLKDEASREGGCACIVFVGNGSKVVQDLLTQSGSLCGYPVMKIEAESSRNAETGKIESVALTGIEELKRKLLSDKIRTVYIIDDLISTGFTISAVKDAVERVLGTTNVEFRGMAMMIQVDSIINSKILSEEGGYARISAPVAYYGRGKVPPTNSLSTLVGTSEKSKMVREEYMQRWIKDPEKFERAVARIRELAYMG